MQILQGLDQDQALAARSAAGATVVTAGAGTGKTRTLTARIAHLVAEQGVPADRIVAVTFTNRAASELRERVAESVGPSAAGLRIGTFHGLSSRILRRHAERARLRSAAFEIADEDHARELMGHASHVAGAYGTYRADPERTPEENAVLEREFETGRRGFVQRALRQVSLWKSWGLSDDVAGDPQRTPRGDDEERLAAAYCAHQYELESRNMADFGDLLLKVVRLLRENDDVRVSEASRVTHMLVDEAQDADAVQVEWVRLLCSEGASVTVVGDEDQNIYGFKGGYPGAMREMAGNAAAEYTLRTNRRCTEEILKPAVTIVGYNRRKGKKELVSGRHGSEVEVTGHPTDANEAAYVAQRIAGLVSEGADPSQIAVLFRTTMPIPLFEEALARKGVASKVCSGTSLVEREEVRDVLSLVRLALNPFDDLSFSRIAGKIAKGLGTVAVDGIMAIAHARDVPLHEACALACDERHGLALKKAAKTASSRLSSSLQALAEEGRWGRPPGDIIATALSLTGYLDLPLKDGSPEERAANVEALRRLAEGFDEPTDFMQQISLLSDVEGFASTDAAKVRLMTIHASKGLEFDHVFCPAFDDGMMPNARALDEGRKGRAGDVWNGPQGGGVEEERRLAHVAFTRARHTLHVTFPWQRRSKVQKARKGKHGGPSSFVEECAFKWKEIGPATTAELGLKKSPSKSRAARLGFDRD